MCALQMYAYLATYKMPDDDPEKLAARVRVNTRRGRRLDRARDDADARLQRALGTRGRFPHLGEGAGVVALGVVRFPHGTVLTCC